MSEWDAVENTSRVRLIAANIPILSSYSDRSVSSRVLRTAEQHEQSNLVQAHREIDDTRNGDRLKTLLASGWDADKQSKYFASGESRRGTCCSADGFILPGKEADACLFLFDGFDKGSTPLSKETYLSVPLQIRSLPVTFARSLSRTPMKVCTEERERAPIEFVV